MGTVLDLFSATAAQQQLRCSPCEGSCGVEGGYIIPVQDTSQAHVADLGAPIARQQDVLALHVEVHDAMCVQPGKPGRNVQRNSLAPANGSLIWRQTSGNCGFPGNCVANGSRAKANIQVVIVERSRLDFLGYMHELSCRV